MKVSVSRAAIGSAAVLAFCIAASTVLLIPAEAKAGESGDLPDHLSDRGVGTPTSMFGTYVEKSELLLYPFFEYYLDDDLEYAPDEFGYGLDEDFRGKYRASEGLIFLGYGIAEDIVFEVEVAVIDASLEKAPEDTTDMPNRIEESGLGDVQIQLDWRWMHETEATPELFSYAEVVFPLNKDKDLIGTSDWEIKFGTGVVRGFDWGTVTLRAAAEYSRAESRFELGEVALEYLKRVSSTWRLYAGIEGTQDEVELITEAQLFLSRRVFLKMNNAFGITSKATDWAPEIGVMFSIPTS
ncbi:MAG: hypothetical protein ABIK83_06045 [Candidatus Zixiibacteriota bacterium]